MHLEQILNYYSIFDYQCFNCDQFDFRSCQRKVETSFVIIAEFVIACAEESAAFAAAIGYSQYLYLSHEFVSGQSSYSVTTCEEHYFVKWLQQHLLIDCCRTQEHFDSGMSLLCCLELFLLILDLHSLEVYLFHLFLLRHFCSHLCSSYLLTSYLFELIFIKFI